MIKRVMLLFLCTLALLWGKEYDPTVTAIQAKLFPKIALLEQHVKEEKTSTLRISILAIDADRNAAVQFKEQIEAAYPEGLLGRRMVVAVERFDPEAIQRPDAVIVLAHQPEVLRSIATWANTHGIVSFAYDPFDLEAGFLVSIYFGKSAKPYLNRGVMQEFRFIFDHYLLRLSKFYAP